MNLLLDTHSFLWFINGNSNLSPTAQALIEDASNQPFFSIASLWEIAIKLSIGKLNLGQSFETLIPYQMDLNGIELMRIEMNHLIIVSRLPFHHRDPFDRLLIAQALAENLPIVSADASFDAYTVQRIW